MFSPRRLIELRPRGWVAAALLLMLLWLPAATAQAESRAEREKRLLALPPADRARLARNFRQYQALPEAERQRLKQLHEELEEDTRSGGNLKSIMDAYYRWVGTLNPGEHDDLRRETDPALREKLVRKLRTTPKPISPSVLQQMSGGAGMTALSLQDLTAVMKILEAEVRPVLPPAQRTRLESLQGLPRFTLILESWLTAQTPEKRPLCNSSGYPHLVQEMAHQISDKTHQRVVVEGRSPEQKRFRLMMLIQSGLRAERERLKPDAVTRTEFFESLKGRERDEIMSLPLEDQPAEITRRYMEAHSEIFPRFQGDLSRLIRQLDPSRRDRMLKAFKADHAGDLPAGDGTSTEASGAAKKGHAGKKATRAGKTRRTDPTPTDGAGGGE